MKHYELIGNPIAWQRTGVKFSTRKIYDKQSNDKLLVGIAIQNQHANEPLFYGPLSVDMIFYFALPKTKRNPPRYYSNKPDIDNCFKFYNDVLNKLVWYDDCQIAAITATKEYTDGEPRVVITVKEL